jgi:hypothetical protein
VKTKSREFYVSRNTFAFLKAFPSGEPGEISISELCNSPYENKITITWEEEPRKVTISEDELDVLLKGYSGGFVHTVKKVLFGVEK